MTDEPEIEAYAKLKEAYRDWNGQRVDSAIYTMEAVGRFLDAMGRKSVGRLQATLARPDSGGGDPERAYEIADRLLDRPNHDPDSDENIVARQLLRQRDALDTSGPGVGEDGKHFLELHTSPFAAAIYEALEHYGDLYPEPDERGAKARWGIGALDRLMETLAAREPRS